MDTFSNLYMVQGLERIRIFYIMYLNMAPENLWKTSASEKMEHQLLFQY